MEQRSERRDLVSNPTVPETDEPGYWRKNAAALRDEGSGVALYFTAVWGAGLFTMILIALPVHAARLTVGGARRLGFKRWTCPPLDWLWAMWHRWLGLNLSKANATDNFSAGLLIPSSAMALVFIARCVHEHGSHSSDS